MVYKEGMDQWLLAVTSDPAAKGSAKDLEVAGAGPVHCHFSLPPSFLTMCSSERCLLFCRKFLLIRVSVHFYDVQVAHDKLQPHQCKYI